MKSLRVFVAATICGVIICGHCEAVVALTDGQRTKKIANLPIAASAPSGGTSSRSPSILPDTRHEQAQSPLFLQRPKLPPWLGNCSLNPSTMVWESGRNKGFSSDWSCLLSSDHGSKIAVFVRPSYVEVMAGLDGCASEPTATYNPSPSQSVYNSWQHVVLDETQKELVIGLEVPPEEKNLYSITEYPVSLEIAVFNFGDAPQRVTEMVFDVQECRSREKILPVLLLAADRRSLTLHNFGYGELASYSAKLELRGDCPPERKSNLFAQAMITDSSASSDKWRVEDLFHLDRRSYESIFSRDVDPWIHARFSAVSKDGRIINKEQSLEVYRADWPDPFPINHVRLKSDLVLPAGRTGYSVSYPVGLTVPPGGSSWFMINFSADKSCQISLLPAFKLSDGTILKEKKMLLNMDVAREAPGVPIHDTIPSQAQDFVSYSSRFFAGLPAAGNKAEKISTLLPRSSTKGNFVCGRADLNSELRSLFALFSLLPPRVKPANKLPPTMRLFGASLRDTSKTAVGELQVDVAAGLSKQCTIGRIDLKDRVSGGCVGQFNWEYPSTVSQMKVMVAGAPENGWFAWLVSGGNTRRLYLAFPGISDCVWSLPIIEEESIENLSVSEDGLRLLLQSSSGNVAVHLPRHIIETAASSVHGGGQTRACAWEDVDSLGRVNLWVPSYASEEQISDTDELNVNVSAKREDAPTTRVAWVEGTKVGVWADGNWEWPDPLKEDS